VSAIDHEIAFRASRYDEGEGDYLNLPLSEAEYFRFVEALLVAETVPLHRFEASLYFEGCLPIEEMARRGPDPRLRPMKPAEPHLTGAALRRCSGRRTSAASSTTWSASDRSAGEQQQRIAAGLGRLRATGRAPQHLHQRGSVCS
jgi:hypothetical protein